MIRLQAGQRESGCSSLSSFLDYSVNQYVHIRSGSHPVRIRLIPGYVSTRYKGRNMKLITRLIFVPKSHEIPALHLHQVIARSGLFCQSMPYCSGGVRNTKCHQG